MALTSDREIKVKGNWYINSFQVKANELIYKGALVNVDSNGYAKNASDTEGEKFIGIARTRADNRGMANGATYCQVGYIQEITIIQSGFTQSDLMKQVYAISDSDIDTEADYINPCGRIISVNDDKVTLHIVIDPSPTKIYGDFEITGSLILKQGSIISLGGVILYDNVLMAPTITSDVDNWFIPGADQINVVGLTSTGNYKITGIIPPYPTKVQQLLIGNLNTALNNITLQNNSPLSLPQYRFNIRNDIQLQKNDNTQIYYNPTTQRWRAIYIA